MTIQPCRVSLDGEPTPLPSSGETLADILAGLAARMSDAQRYAFVAKMAELDRQRAELSRLSVTLGSA